MLVPNLLVAGQAVVQPASAKPARPAGDVVWIQPQPAVYHIGDYVDPHTKQVFHERHRIYVREVSGYWARMVTPRTGARKTSPGYAAQREGLQRQELEAELARQRAQTARMMETARQFKEAQDILTAEAAKLTAAGKEATPAKLVALQQQLAALQARLAAIEKEPRKIQVEGEEKK